VLEGVFLGLALAMDAFAVALTQGAKFRPDWRGALGIALIFSAFHAIMPLIGWGIGAFGLSVFEAVDHWIAFALLGFIGGKMMLAGEGEDSAQKLAGITLVVTAFATSIDVLAAGITLPTLNILPVLAAAKIGGITFVMSLVGVALGRVAGDAFGVWAERAGGVILIALGCNILGEHMGWL
jgi:manganese efflux pump family protein